MKVSFFKLVVLTLGAAAMIAACQPQKGNDVSVSLGASSASFTDGKVDLTVTLSGKSTSAVSASITTAGSLPSSALTFNNKVSIAAGETSATVPVTVDASSLPGGSYEAVFTIASVTGGELNSAKASVTVTLQVSESKSVVSISSSDTEFGDNGKAKITLALDKAASSDITVNLELLNDPEFEMIPAEAISFSNPVTIAAGSTQKEVEFTLDKTKLTKGVTSYAIVSIKSVSENAELDARKNQAVISATVSIVANLRSDWSVRYGGDMEYEGGTYSAIIPAGTGSDSYYIQVYTKGAVAQAFASVTEYLLDLENQVIATLGTADAEQIKSGEHAWLYDRFYLGEYEVWLIGCTASGHITGDYTKAEFTIEPSASMIAAYENWKGTWLLNRTEIEVKEKSKAEFTYTITFGPNTINARLSIDGALEFIPTVPCVAAGNVGFMGYYPAEEAGYISLYSGTEPVGVATLDESGTKGVVESTFDGYFDGMATLTISGNQVTGWGDFDCEFPGTIARPVPEDQVDPNYKKWLGTWNVSGFSLPLTLAQDVANESYTFGLFYSGISSTYAYVQWNKDNNQLEFNFGAGGGNVSASGTTYSLYLCGIENTGYVAMGDDNTDLLATAALDASGSSATITPNHYEGQDDSGAAVDAYPTKLGLLGYNSSSGWANFGMLFDVPTTMTLQSAGAPSTQGNTFAVTLPSAQRVAGQAPVSARKAAKFKRISTERR